MLSGIKLKLSMAMKGNVILPEDMAVQFENALVKIGWRLLNVAIMESY
jgi:hypothetical protein